MDDLIFAVSLFAALAYALLAGLYFTFSMAIMPALRRLGAATGMGAMQTINVVIVNPIFLLIFLGSAAASVALAVASVLRWDEDGSGYLLAGSVVGFIGSLLITGIVNVPMNDELAKAEPGTPEGARVWESYLDRWTTWNHIRALASLAATALLILAIR